MPDTAGVTDDLKSVAAAAITGCMLVVWGTVVVGLLAVEVAGWPLDVWLASRRRRGRAK